MEVWQPDDGPAWGWADDLACLRGTALAVFLSMVVGLGSIAAVVGYLAGSQAACVAPATTSTGTAT